MDNIASYVGLGGVPLVMALVALVKTTIPDLPARYFPAVSLVFGIIVNEALAWLLKTDWQVAVLVGVITGLASSGLFAIGKAAEVQAAMDADLLDSVKSRR
jgi:hypothetical protein